MPFHMYTNYAVDILHSPPKQNQKDWASFYLKCDGRLNMTSFSALFPHLLIQPNYFMHHSGHCHMTTDGVFHLG